MEGKSGSNSRKDAEAQRTGNQRQNGSSVLCAFAPLRSLPPVWILQNPRYQRISRFHSRFGATEGFAVHKRQRSRQLKVYPPNVRSGFTPMEGKSGSISRKDAEAQRTRNQRQNG